MSVFVDKKDLYSFLFVKSNGDKLVQYRNIFRFEAYSDIAIERLRKRIVNNEFVDYREKVLRIIENSILSSQSDAYVCIEMNDSSHEVVSKVRWEKVKAKLDIIATFRGNELRLESSNLVILSRFALFVLCDCLDVSDVLRVTIDGRVKELCLFFFERKLIFDRDLTYLNLSTPISKLGNVCGYQFDDDGEVICQPYRSDIVSCAYIINDILSAELSFFKERHISACYNGCELNSIVLADKWQRNLVAAGYSFLGEYCAETMNLDDWIVSIDKKRRNCSFPHKFFTFLYTKDSSDPTEIIIWNSGKSIDINEFAEVVRRLSVLSVGQLINWDIQGEELLAIWKGVKCGRMHLIDKAQIEKRNTNVYSIAVACVSLKYE